VFPVVVSPTPSALASTACPARSACTGTNLPAGVKTGGSPVTRTVRGGVRVVEAKARPVGRFLDADVLDELLEDLAVVEPALTASGPRSMLVSGAARRSPR